MTTILETLRPFGITRCYKGFPLTVYAIHLAVMEEDRLEEITEKIYRETADHFGCKWTAVERNLRTVVSRAWQVNPDLLCRMAGYPLTAAPTASEFIEIIASYIIRSRQMYGDNVFEKDGIRRDRTGDGEKTRCLCGKRGIFNRDGPAMGPQIIRQLERRASRRSASFFHALASPGRPRNGGGASGAYQPAEGRKTLIQGRFRAQEGPLGPSRKSQQQTKRTGFAALEDSIADEAPEGKRAKRANRALNRAGINSRGQKQGFGGADRRGGHVTSR